MIPAAYYHTVFLYLIIVLTFVCSSQISANGYVGIIRGRNNFFVAMILSLILAVWLGMRPISGVFFGDTANYAYTYYLYANRLLDIPGDSGEWIWNQFMYFCSQSIDVSTFFTIIDLGYFGFSLWACRRLTPNNVLISMLFVMGALSFYTYGTNGIRNGLACSITLVILSYVRGSKFDLIKAVLLSFVAINVHKTTMLPICMMMASIWFVRSFKWAYTFWILSIFISLAAGGAVSSFFASLGFDSRLSYLGTIDADKFSRTGFRWDFLIYSMMPIILGYYIIYRRNIRNRMYEIILNTYTLSNAFWVMVIRANYSNRFAYLSWFMYPIVLAYPLLRLDIWNGRQGKYLRLIMIAHIGFTWFMSTFYWA